MHGKMPPVSKTQQTGGIFIMLFETIAGLIADRIGCDKEEIKAEIKVTRAGNYSISPSIIGTVIDMPPWVV